MDAVLRKGTSARRGAEDVRLHAPLPNALRRAAATARACHQPSGTDDEQADAVRQRLALYRGTDQLKRFRSVGFSRKRSTIVFGLAVMDSRRGGQRAGLFRRDIDLHLVPMPG